MQKQQQYKNNKHNAKTRRYKNNNCSTKTTATIQK
jgi:hypothetical protein